MCSTNYFVNHGFRKFVENYAGRVRHVRCQSSAAVFARGGCCHRIFTRGEWVSVENTVNIHVKMPPKKREKELDGQKGPRMDQIQADHELFLQAFESEYASCYLFPPFTYICFLSLISTCLSASILICFVLTVSLWNLTVNLFHGNT